MRQRKRKRGQFGSKKDKGSSEDRKGVLQSVGRALAGKKSEAPNAPTAADPVSAKTPDFNVDKMLRSRGISIPEVTPSAKLSAPAAKPATPAAKPAAPAAKPAAPAAKPATPATKPATAPSKPTSREPEVGGEKSAGNDYAPRIEEQRDAFDEQAKTDYYNEPKDASELKARQSAANSLQKAMAMSEGERKKQAIQKARGQALDAGVSIARVDRFINEPAFAKANTIRRVRAAGEKAAEAGKPKDRFTQFVEKFKKENNGAEPSGEEKANWYASEAANLRAQGFTGVEGDGGLAELYQMQADKADGVAPGTYTALSKGAKKIAPDSRIIDRYSKMVAEGRMSPEAARRKFGEDMLDKMRYDDPRLSAREEAEYQAAVAEAKRTGSPIPERQLPGADIDFAKEAARFPRKQKPTIIRNSGNYITGAGTTGVAGTRGVRGN